MKKKIFIAGDVREYDSANPTAFTDSIKAFIKNNLVSPETASEVSVTVQETASDHLIITFPFSTGDEIMHGTVSNPLYRCFFGDCAKFRPEYSLDYRLNFGSAIAFNWRVPIKDIKEAHKRNTSFYKADRYKSLEVEESDKGLTITIKF